MIGADNSSELWRPHLTECLFFAKQGKARKKEGLKESCCAKWHNCAILLFPGRNVPTGVFEAQIVRLSTALDAFKLGSFIFNSSDGSFPLNDSAGAVLLNLFLL